MDSKEPPQNDQKRKMPDFIYVDKDYGRESSGTGTFEYEFDPSFKGMAKQEYPLTLRLFCLFFSLVIFFVSAVALIFVLFFFLLNLFTFFKMDHFYSQTKSLWRRIKSLFVSGLGLLIAVVSPAFGFSIILVYLMLKGKGVNDDFVSRMMKQRFYR